MDLQRQVLGVVSTEMERFRTQMHPHPIPSQPISDLHKDVVPHPPQSLPYLVNRLVSKDIDLGTIPCPYPQSEE